MKVPKSLDHAKILACLTDDIRWKIPGLFDVTGKEEFDRVIENDAFVGSPDITIARMIEEDNIVVVEGAVRQKRKDGGHLDAVFCDVFQMAGGKIAHLTSYFVNQ